MLKPKEQMEKIFEDLYKSKLEEIIKSCHSSWEKEIISNLNVIKNKFEEIQLKMKNLNLLTPSINLFKISNDENDKLSPEQLKSFDKLMGKFLLESLQGKWKNKEEYKISSISLKPFEKFPEIEEELKNEDILNWLIFYLNTKNGVF